MNCGMWQRKKKQLKQKTEEKKLKKHGGMEKIQRKCIENEIKTL